jgi:hypothetical protein
MRKKKSKFSLLSYLQITKLLSASPCMTHRRVLVLIAAREPGKKKKNQNGKNLFEIDLLKHFPNFIFYNILVVFSKRSLYPRSLKTKW